MFRLSKKASQNSPPAMAANNLDYFLPRHVRGKKYFTQRECFSPIYGRKSAGRSDFYFGKKGYAIFAKISNRGDASKEASPLLL